MKRLTFGDFQHQVSLSPNGKNFITTYSNAQSPAKIALLDTKGKIIRELGDAKGVDLDIYALAKTELIRIKSADGGRNAQSIGPSECAGSA